jgi:hypothetical protein
MTVNIGYLVPELRLAIGDTDPTTYRYMSDWLKLSITLAIKALNRRWNHKYIIDSNGLVYRNPLATNFLYDEATYGVIEASDEYLIILQASIIVLEGSLENSAWNFVSWKDAEMAFSNLESSRSRGDNLKRLIDELNSQIKFPTKKLAWTTKGSLPGYQTTGSQGFEKTGDY